MLSKNKYLKLKISNDLDLSFFIACVLRVNVIERESLCVSQQTTLEHNILIYVDILIIFVFYDFR